MTKRKNLNLVRATDRAIAEENRRFLSDPKAIADAEAEGDLYRRRLEAEGILPRSRVVGAGNTYRLVCDENPIYKPVDETRKTR